MTFQSITDYSCPSNFTEWDIVQGLSPYNATGEINLTWKDGLMYLGIAVAIIGFASAFFAGNAMQCIAFGALGIVSLFGEYYVRKESTLMELQHTRMELQHTNSELRDIHNELVHHENELRNEERDLREEHGLLRQRNETLEGIRDNLQLLHAQFLNSRRQEVGVLARL